MEIEKNTEIPSSPFIGTRAVVSRDTLNGDGPKVGRFFPNDKMMGAVAEELEP